MTDPTPPSATQGAPLPSTPLPSTPDSAPTDMSTHESSVPVEPAELEGLRAVCNSCGAQVVFEPGTTSLHCPRCGSEQEISAVRPIVEHSYDDWLALHTKPVAQIGALVLQCHNCGASTETNDLAGTCRFCKGPLVQVEDPPGLIAPEAVVPFGLAKDGATDAFRTWARSRHLAPRAMKKVGSTDSMQGTYVPHWTYDAQTSTAYEGRRGDYYYTTETRYVSDGDGKGHTETYQQRHTRWRNTSGQVSRPFDDLLVPASGRVPATELDKMGPWRLPDAQAFQPSYLAGFAALRYDVDPDTAMATAQARMQHQITNDCEQDIGGDEQQVTRMDVRYSALMFKLVLLPLWIATYITAGKTFNVYVNANTGEVVGERPWSKVKIAALVVAVLVVAAAIVVAVVLHKK